MNSIKVANVISPADRNAINTGLTEHALAQGVPPRTETPLAVLMHDDKNTLVAGLEGITFWQWLYIDKVWVSENLRGQGVGRQLMLAAEAEATKRGCTGAYLLTHDFNSPDFYRKLGYKPYFELPNFPVGHNRTGFMKQLAA